MQRLLFRDWRFALLWAIGLTFSVAAFFSEGGGHEQLEQQADQIRANRATQAEMLNGPVNPESATGAMEPGSENEMEHQFGDPVADTAPLDPGFEPPAAAARAPGTNQQAGEPDQTAQP